MTDILQEREDGRGSFAAPTSAGAAWAEGEDEPKLRGQVVDPFEFYVVRFEGMEYRAPKPGNTASGSARALIVDGPAGTVGERVFGDFYLGVSTTESTGEKVGDSWVKVPKSPEKLSKNIEAFQKLLNKLGRIGKFQTVRIVSSAESALKGYCAQWANGFDAIIGIRVDKRSASPRNTFGWEGIRALTDPAHDKKLKAAGKTALDEAKLQIAARALKAPKASPATVEAL